MMSRQKDTIFTHGPMSSRVQVRVLVQVYSCSHFLNTYVRRVHEEYCTVVGAVRKQDAILYMYIPVESLGLVTSAPVPKVVLQSTVYVVPEHSVNVQTILNVRQYQCTSTCSHIDLLKSNAYAALCTGRFVALNMRIDSLSVSGEGTQRRPWQWSELKRPLSCPSSLRYAKREDYRVLE
jgi:hypothetical protein